MVNKINKRSEDLFFRLFLCTFAATKKQIEDEETINIAMCAERLDGL